MINTLVLMLMTSSFFGLLSFGVIAQSNEVSQLDLPARTFEICTLMNDEGQIEKLTVRPSQSDLARPVPLDKNVVLAAIERIFPVEMRGEMKNKLEMYYRGAVGEHFIFENVQIDLTNVCLGEVCGLSFAKATRLKRTVE